MMSRDIFGNIIQENTNPTMQTNYKQKLAQQKQKDAYTKYMQEKRQEQYAQIKSGLQTSGRLIKTSGQKLKKVSKSTGLRNKLSNLIRGHDAPIYDKKNRWGK